LRDAVVDAASVSSGLWLSYLFVFFYLAIAAGGVTHRDLFFENPVKLPFLNVDLPLLGFFALGPLLFLIVHAYILLHFALLASKVGAFDGALQDQIADDDTRARLRRQLPSNIFVQFLAGPREVRTGAMGFFLKAIAWISLVIGPIALLSFFQLQFLPYHNEAVSWWHRVTVLLDLVVLWTLWPSVARGTTTPLRWRDFGRGKVVACLATSMVPALLVFTVATFPGEWLDQHLPSLRFVPTSLTPLNWASPHELLVAGEIDFIAQRPRSLWSNRLVLPWIDVIDHAKFDTEIKISNAPLTVSLRGRRLEGAVLPVANLRKVDFTGAQLDNALLSRADLRGARFHCASTGLRMGLSNKKGFAFKCVSLRGAALDFAQLQGTLLVGAQLQGASFEEAQLQGASLDRAHLQGASLDRAHLQGASLDNAQLQGASLDNAQLQGASLDNAQLQGASLDNAQLQGASLDNAQLQGASLDNAQLQGASLDHAFVWRSNVAKIDARGARVIAPETAPQYKGLNCAEDETCDWSADAYAELARLINTEVPDGQLRRLSVERVASLDPKSQVRWRTDQWTELQLSLAQSAYERTLAEILRETGCKVEGAPYVLRGLLQTLDDRFDSDSAQEISLAAAFLDEVRCPGAYALSEQDKLKLQQIRNRATSSGAPHRRR
jgi:uncharacterized protein YjbI with pentapeptide repeats